MKVLSEIDHVEIDQATVKRAPHCGKAAAAKRLMSIPPASISAVYLESLSDTDVLHYALDIEVSNLDPFAHTCLMSGSNTFTIQSRSASLSDFQFRLQSQFNITNAYVNEITPVTVTTQSASTRLVTLDRTYSTNEVFTLTIEYSGITVPNAFGSIWVDRQPGGIPIVSTLSEPYYSYTWWPAKDGDVYLRGDNSDKATLDFWITVPDNLIVASNGVRQGIDTLSGNRLRYRWASQYPIATYLVSFAATEYNTWTVDFAHQNTTMPVEFYIYPAYDSASNRQAWEKVVNMLDTFGQLFGEYPFIDEKYGIYNFPFGGGMEHQTMTGQGSFGESLSAHELAHQWWGDEVTCETWNHIWLNEGFASYSEALWYEFRPGSSGLPALKGIMNPMKYYGAGSVYVYNHEVNNLGQIFNGDTSYDKGAWVVHMLRHVLGDENFFAALLEYRAAYKNDAATTEELQSICEIFYRGDLGWFFSQWVYGERTPSYSWGWDVVEVNGETFVLISIDQTQDLRLYQFFTMPVDIDIDGNRHVVFNDSDMEYFVIPVSSIPTTVEFDPDEWILRNSLVEESYTPGPPTIVETSPTPGDYIENVANIDSISILFHTDVNVIEENITLTGAHSGAYSFTISSNTNVNPLVLTLGTPLPADTYTLTISGGIEASNSGFLLDGEITDPTNPASFPSGDGQPGGETVIQFTVTPPVPAVSQWGLTASVLLLTISGTLILQRRRYFAK